MTIDVDDRAAVLSCLRRTAAASADETVDVAEGWVCRTRSLPSVYTLNQLGLHAALRPAVAVALAERHQGDLPYRHVVAEHAATVLGLRRFCADAGWAVSTEVLMVLGGPPAGAGGPAEGPEVVELDEETLLDVLDGWMAEVQPGLSADTLAQLRAYHRREAAVWPERRLGLLDGAGRPAAVTELRSDGATAWVEHVYTRPDQRGRGHARRLVGHAAACAAADGHRRTFLVADDGDWPKHLYAALGFRPVAWVGTFHLDLAPGR